MSDLIIKPSGTNANFKVQNPSGTDKIVMNSSGTITTGTLGSGVTFPAGHIIQVVNATLSNASTSAVTSETGVVDVINQITITSGNAVMINFQVNCQMVGSSNSVSTGRIREGTVASLGNILTAGIGGDGDSSNNDHHYSLWGFDASPADTTPDYVFTLERGSSSTTSVNQYQGAAPWTVCLLFEIQQ